MKILVLGTGGVGGYFGGRLHESGADVTWLVREARLQNLREQGLRVKSPFGDMQLQAKTVTAETVTPDYDLILLAPKAYDLDSAVGSLSRALSGNAVLLPFLNGLAHVSQLDQRFGRQRVAAGVAQIAATQNKSGEVLHLNRVHSLIIGERDPAHRSVLKQFHLLCQNARFDTNYSDDIEQDLWTKWTFLATLAGATTLFRGAVGKIVATDEGGKLIRQMYAECLAVACAQGRPINSQGQEKALSVLLQQGSDFTASMYRDLIGGQKTEHEHVLGQMCRMAQASDVPVPLMRAAWCHMQVEAGDRFPTGGESVAG